MSTAVHSVQIKRKRDQDPLQALLIRNNKRKRTESVVFRLAGTYDEAPTVDSSHIALTANEESQRSFKIPKKHKSQNFPAGPSEEDQAMPQALPAVPTSTVQDQDEKIPDQLQSMIDEFMANQNARDTNDSQSIASAEPDLETEDYVYDVYFGEQIATTVGFTDTQIGYIELADDQELTLLADDEGVSEPDVFVDDEDSNAEDFYKNEYPDEDNQSDSDSLGIADRLGDFHISDHWSEDDNDQSWYS